MKIRSFGEQAFFRLLANIIQAITFVLVARSTENSEIGILSFLLTLNAFQVAFFDFGVGKKILLAKGNRLLKELLTKVFRTTLPFIALQILFLAAMGMYFTDVSSIFFAWSFTIATERILDYFQLFLLSILQNKLTYIIMLLRRLMPLITLIFWLYKFSTEDHILDLYIIATLMFNLVIILSLFIFLKHKQTAEILVNQDSRLVNQTRSLAFLSVLEQYKNLDIILIMIFFGSSSTGEYSLIARLFNPVLLVIASVLSQMVQGEHRINTKQAKSHKTMFLLLLVVTSILVVTFHSKSLISLVYGYATEDMYFYFLVFTFATLFNFLSGILEAQFVIDFRNQDLVRTQLWIYGSALLFTIFFLASGDIKLGLLVYSSAYFLKLAFLLFRYKVHNPEAPQF